MVVTSFFSRSCFYPLLPLRNWPDTTSTKIITKQLPRESKKKPVKLSNCQTVKLSNCQAVKLSSCEGSCLTTRNTSGRKFRWETFCVSCSFTLHIIDFTFKKNFSRYIRKYITKTIEYESGIYFSIGTTTLFIIPRFPNLIIHYLLLT